MKVAPYVLIWSIWSLVFVAAIALTMRFNQKDSVAWKVMKFFGVAVSTVPIVGVVQGLAARSKAPGYAQACLWQAGVGVLAYTLIQVILK